MPESVDINLVNLKEKILKKIHHFTGRTDYKAEEQPIAFGLKALNIIFVMDESKGSTENLEKDIASINGIQSVEITDVRRAIG